MDEMREVFGDYERLRDCFYVTGSAVLHEREILWKYMISWKQLRSSRSENSGRVEFASANTLEEAHSYLHTKVHLHHFNSSSLSPSPPSFLIPRRPAPSIHAFPHTQQPHSPSTPSTPPPYYRHLQRYQKPQPQAADTSQAFS